MVSTPLVRGLSGDSKPDRLFPPRRAATSRVPTHLAGPQLCPALTTCLLPGQLYCCVCDSQGWEGHLPCLPPSLPPLLGSCSSNVCSTWVLMDSQQR